MNSNPSSHPPQEDDRIKLARLRRTEGPSRSPLAEQIDDLLELTSSRCQTIFGRLTARCAPPFQYARSLQPPQPLCKQRARHVRKTAFEFVEVFYVGKKLTDDEHGPAIRKNLGRACYWAILAVQVHVAQ